MIYICFLVLFMNAAGFKAQPIDIQTSVKGYKRAVVNKDAFSNDFNDCMINHWNVAAGLKGPVLRTSPTDACNKAHHSKLCYGTQGNAAPAQFISCFNTKELIPEFAAYIVPTGAYDSAVEGKYKRPDFRQDEGPLAPNPQAHSDNCINPHPEGKDPNYCNRGHLVPSGQFNTKDERDLTFIMTNVAPQWLPFNAGNWAVVEQAVKEYAKAAGHGVYVFTGTAGIAKYWTTSLWLRKPYVAVSKPGTTGKMVVPKYFWKAVCDPIVGQSIVFFAENNVDVTSTDQVIKGTCTGEPMTKRSGVVYCYSVSAASGIRNKLWNMWHGVSLPNFDPINCGTAKMGTFLDTFLLGKWQ